MSNYIKEYRFENPHIEITYFNDKPLELTNEFCFYHNKNKFRKELTRLQNIFQKYLKNPLTVAGIRDSYLKQEFSDEFLIILFTIAERIKEANKIIESHLDKNIKPRCYYIECRSEYFLLLTKDMDGLVSGIDIMEDIFTQTIEDYLNQQQFDDYIKIRPFKLLNCVKST
ncbi:MAG: hypothetical protein ACFFAN_02345 [Promethearchaeota archaeon]